MQIPSTTPAAWTVGTIIAYLGLYTAYDKTEKKLKVDGLVDLLGRKGLDFTLVQMNKVISLAGLTGLGCAFTPGFEQIVPDTKELVTISGGLLTAHFAYSLYKYYGTPNIPHFSTFPSIISEMTSEKAKERLVSKRKWSFLCGLSSLSILTGWELDMMPVDPVSIMSLLTLSTLHFYLMEVDFKDQLQVRPFGYLAFITPVVAIALGSAKLLGF